MLSTRPNFALILILSAGLCLPIFSWAQSSQPSSKPSSKASSLRHSKHKPAAAKKVEEPPPPPPPPPTPEQLPAQPPTVTYQNDQLTIIAPNSTLSDILNAVRTKTGATIDVPPGANERVVSSFGPGPARDVLASLLNGTHFNYVMVGTVANPDSLAQVILTRRTGAETPPAVQAGQPGMPMSPQPGVPPQFPQPYSSAQVGQVPTEAPPGTDGTDEDDPSPDINADNSNADNSNDQGAPEQVNQGNEQGQNANQPVVKTPEQLLQELQRQQQMMQQPQQGQQSQGQPQQQPPGVYPNARYPQQQPPQSQPQ